MRQTDQEGYVDMMPDDPKLKKLKKRLTFVRGFDIIILALSDRAKLIKSH